MKNSSSTTSLTDLITVKDVDECFICLESTNEKDEPLIDGSLMRSCGCKFMVHPDCWNQWMKDKSDFDCPICRRDSAGKALPPPPLNPAANTFPIINTNSYYKYLCILALFSVVIVIIGILSTTKN